MSKFSDYVKWRTGKIKETGYGEMLYNCNPLYYHVDELLEEISYVERKTDSSGTPEYRIFCFALKVLRNHKMSLSEVDSILSDIRGFFKNNADAHIESIKKEIEITEDNLRVLNKEREDILRLKNA